MCRIANAFLETGFKISISKKDCLTKIACGMKRIQKLFTWKISGLFYANPAEFFISFPNLFLLPSLIRSKQSRKDLFVIDELNGAKTFKTGY